MCPPLSPVLHRGEAEAEVRVGLVRGQHTRPGGQQRQGVRSHGTQAPYTHRGYTAMVHKPHTHTGGVRLRVHSQGTQAPYAHKGVRARCTRTPYPHTRFWARWLCTPQVLLAGGVVGSSSSSLRLWSAGLSLPRKNRGRNTGGWW